MMKKKILVIALVSLAFLGGCGKGKAVKTDSAPKETTEASSEAVPTFDDSYEKINEAMSSEEYVNGDIDARKAIIDKLMKELEDKHQVFDVKYDDASKVYYFERSNGEEANIDLNSVYTEMGPDAAAGQ